MPSVFRKHLFDLPENVVYLDGNSLGPLPRAVPDRLNAVMRQEWGQMLVTGWNAAGWMEQPRKTGDRVGRLIGAPPGSVVMGDTLSIKVFQAVAAGLKLRPDRNIILSDTGNFPSDLYMVEGLIGMMGGAYQLRTVAPDAVYAAIDESVAVVLLTEVDYRTGRRHDTIGLTQAAQDAGAVMIWDLAHSAGAFAVDISSSGAEMAIGCTYKYLNAGPGAPAFIYVRPDLAEHIEPALSGWLGHRAPFAFAERYQPGTGIERMRVGTPPVLQMAALDCALDIWDCVDLEDLRAESVRLQERLISGVAQNVPDVTLASPGNPELRGSQVSFSCENGYAAMQALIDLGVIGDFRAPDIMRFGITPLYISSDDIDIAIECISRVFNERIWDRPQYHARKAVT